MNSTTELVKKLREATGAGYLDCKQALLAHEGNYEQAAAFLRKRNIKKVEKKADRDTTEGVVVVKASGNKVCAVALQCETDFVALTPNFKEFAHRLADLVQADPALTGAEKVAAAPLPSGSGETVHDAIRKLIGKVGENIRLGTVARYAGAANSVVHGYVHAGAISGFGEEEGRLGVLVELGLQDKSAVSNEAGAAVAHDLALHIASAAPRYVSVAGIPAAELANRKEALRAEAAAENKPAAIQEKIFTGRLQKFYRQSCLMLQPFLMDDTATVEEWLQAKSKELGTALSVTRFNRIEISP